MYNENEFVISINIWPFVILHILFSFYVCTEIRSEWMHSWFYRAGSTESDHPLDSGSNSFGLKKNPSLYRKSLSLEQTSMHPSVHDQVSHDRKNKYILFTWVNVITKSVCSFSSSC